MRKQKQRRPDQGKSRHHLAVASKGQGQQRWKGRGGQRRKGRRERGCPSEHTGIGQQPTRLKAVCANEQEAFSANMARSQRSNADSITSKPRSTCRAAVPAPRLLARPKTKHAASLGASDCCQPQAGRNTKEKCGGALQGGESRGGGRTSFATGANGSQLHCDLNISRL